jgi:CheY-like chemotaxis protein
MELKGGKEHRESIAETILLVEDNDDDVLFAKRAFRKAGIVNELVVFHYGDKALNYLMEQHEGAAQPDRPRVGAVFLDIHLPCFSGLELLERLRESLGPEFVASLPVFMLSGSDDPSGMERAQILGARAYLVKPPTPQALLQVLRASKWPGLRIG